MEEDHFSNEHQRKVATRLLGDGYTVWCDPNSEITVYLKEGDVLTSTDIVDTPYRIAHVWGCTSEENFTTRITLRADWSEVDE